MSCHVRQVLVTKSNYTATQKTGEVKKCGRNCATCPYLIEGSVIQMEHGEVFHIQEKMTCLTENVIYIMICRGCDATYIGETGQQFCKRMNSHRSHINRAEYRKLQVSDHIHRCPGTQTLDVKFKTCPFFKMPLNCSRIEREAKEAFFQKKILSISPSWTTDTW